VGEWVEENGGERLRQKIKIKKKKKETT